MKKKFRINRFIFSVSYPDDFPVPEDFLKFELSECELKGQENIYKNFEYSYTIKFSEVFPDAEGKAIYLGDDLRLYEKDGFEKRYIGIEGFGITYGYMEELSQNSSRILVKPEYREKFAISTMFTSLFALEKRLLEYDSILLHSSYIEYKGAAILFSAPSGTGKTTQSKLWEKFRGAETINGDRALLCKRDGIWHAGGWPVCGTSKACQNKEYPIHAIVMLSQAKTNSIERLLPMKAFSQIYSQITINRWDADAHNRAMNLIEQLISDVPVYHLACDISEEAVSCLEKAIIKGLSNY